MRTEKAQRQTSNSDKARAGVQRPIEEHVQELFEQFVVPSYARFDLVLERGEGSYVWDVSGRRYLDLGGGIAVCALGHANPEITEALAEQSQKLIHVSNLYYTEPQARLAKRIVDLIAPGRVFFCNSGAEANEGLFKLARKFGHDEGRYEIITAVDSFHGRTLAGIAATGQEKVKKGFEPIVPGFKQVPFNDLEAMRAAITKSTAAILIEAIQGESGITIATPEYLVGLRKLCDEHNLLLLLDEVQAGHFRTGKFYSWQRILEGGDFDFLPDGISMAKALGGGFPIGAFWVRAKFGGLLSAGTHASTFGGTPLACAVAERILDVIEREDLMANARRIGDFLVDRLRRIQGKYPRIISDVRGLGLMIGIEFEPKLPIFTNEEKSAAIQVVNRLHEKGVLTVPAATSVIRLLPPLNLSESEADEGLHAIKNVVEELNG
ncbi:MAG TPA: aspartate aminotransferase family protein [Candidatus Udaeobacter sp.]|jgi:acetylornithine/N-succinyldiaminopimelate aminotransferase|nr:aspartate aminotransferase family protein [Candidatus Udaeobacter sp.]